MHFKEHCKECEEKIGKPWEVVHRWLDEMAFKSGSLNPFHRMYRHHRKGIEEVRKMWGDEAAKAAELHIMSDEGRIPEDEAVYRDELNNMFWD